MTLVHELIDEILALDTETGIFDVVLKAQPHTSGFLAWTNFRSLSQAYYSVMASGDTPEEALEKLKTTLLDKFMSREYYMADRSTVF